MSYNIEIPKIIDEIKKSKSKTVLIQLADGLKPLSKNIVEEIESKTKAEVFIWLGSCFGGCDIPISANFLGVDLIIQIGHNKFNRTAGGW